MPANDLLTLLRAQSQEQLGLIYETYRSEFLHWICKEFHCSQEDGRDIYQTTIIIFYDNLRSGRLNCLVSSLKTYLFAIGKNVARENLRRIKREAKLLQETQLRRHFTGQDDEPLDECLFEAAEKALTKLEGPARRIIELFYYERKSMQEISDIMHYSNADTAKNQKCKSMVRLREFFDQERTHAHEPDIRLDHCAALDASCQATLMRGGGTVFVSKS